MQLAGPRRPEGRPAERQARPVGRVRRLPRLHAWATTCASSTGTSTRASRRLFVKLFVEEEDVTVTLLVDASASMAAGRPAKLLFAKRAAAALGYIGLASEDRVARQRPVRAGRPAPAGDARLRPRLPAAGRPVRDRAGRRPDRPRRGRPPRRAPSSAAAGVVVLLSDLLDPGRRPGHPRARGHRLRARSSSTSCRPTSSTRRSRATCGSSTSRPATASTSPSTSRRSTPTRPASRPGRRASPTSPPSAGRATSTCRRTCHLADLMFAELRRRRVLG